MIDRSVLGNHQSEFLSRHWQKKPLLIRNAFPGGLNYVSGDELAGLASQEGIDSRLVIEHGPKSWETRHGPFAEDIWGTLPAHKWTILVQAVDRLLPEVSRLRDRFRFLPNWRVDDIMISYAVDQGGVGAHTDNYDVFLIQGQGRRRWEIGANALVHPELEPDLDMKILKHFEPVESFVLEPGDMLYLPPGFAHNGVALGESITYSVGFRAPHQKEMLLSFVQFCNQIEGDEIFYTDQTMPENREPGLILPGELQRLRELMLTGLQNEANFMKWIGGFLTEPRSFHEALERPVTEKILRAGLKKARPVERAEGARFAYYQVSDKLHFAAEGECFVLDRSLTDLVALLCREQSYTAAELLAHSEKLGFMELLCHLWNQSYVRWADEA
ncbi:cupin domain-containing protein [Oligoflexus tunisiensis]|uniref:cupin domain-containing protein n=1 Tax=Oligoflexus tunisiensis TaxID=708132 RepID=UPI000A9181D4|nr:cupin domain-containing protein [Oligoflexus tunisiensis]